MMSTICSRNNTPHISPPFLVKLCNLSHYKAATETEYRYSQGKAHCFMVMNKLLLHNMSHTANAAHYMQSVFQRSVSKTPHQLSGTDLSSFEVIFLGVDFIGDDFTACIFCHNPAPISEIPYSLCKNEKDDGPFIL